jgi:outer membrane protein assembly factor BamD
MHKLISFFLLFLIISSCSIFDDDNKKDKSNLLTEGQLYEQIQNLLNNNSYDLAIQNLQLLESRFPFGSYADQAQLDIIYAYYKNNDEGATITAAERFISLHPSHPDVDYAWYMKGLAKYSLKPGLLSRFYQADKASKDVESARNSFKEFSDFLYRYPKSIYASDALARMVYIKSILARHELVVANYYIKRKAYTAAINRAKTVIENYPKTEAVSDALAILIFCYYTIGITELADENFKILKLNFPDHESINDEKFIYDSSFNLEKRSRLNKFSMGFIDPPKAPIFDSRDNQKN